MESLMSSKFIYWVQKYSITSAPLIHIGAHLVQERDEYQQLNFYPVLWFEGIPEIAKRASEILKKYPDQHIINRALWSTNGVRKRFHFAGHEGSSSSLLEPYLISASHPEVKKIREFEVETSTLDTEISKMEKPEQFKVMVLDVQGAEIEVLKGAIHTLQNIDYIISEISQIELYKGYSEVKALERFLTTLDYVFIASEMNRATGWGEGLFVHKRALRDLTNREHEHAIVGKRVAKGRIMRTLFIRIRRAIKFK